MRFTYMLDIVDADAPSCFIKAIENIIVVFKWKKFKNQSFFYQRVTVDKAKYKNGGRTGIEQQWWWHSSQVNRSM